MKISAKRIGKTKGPPQWGPAITTEVHRQLSNDKTVLRLAKEIVSDWDHKPNFGYQVVNQGGALIGKLLAVGRWAKLWQWVSGGTKGPYKIRPRRAKALAFRTGYKPRTTPKGRTATFGGPGVATGPWRRAQEVTHPGIKARDFETLIRSKYATTFRQVIRKAIADGAAKARRGIRITYQPSTHSRRRRG